MRLGDRPLLEMIAILRDALLEGTDVSQKLRDLEFKVVDGKLELTERYLSTCTEAEKT